MMTSIGVHPELFRPAKPTVALSPCNYYGLFPFRQLAVCPVGGERGGNLAHSLRLLGYVVNKITKAMSRVPREKQSEHLATNLQEAKMLTMNIKQHNATTFGGGSRDTATRIFVKPQLFQHSQEFLIPERPLAQPTPRRVSDLPFSAAVSVTPPPPPYQHTKETTPVVVNTGSPFHLSRPTGRAHCCCWKSC